MGVLAGIINTLAGSGSAVTLSLLVFLGLPANIANGTNRIGVLVQTIVGLFTFHKSGAVPTQHLPSLVIPAILGAIAGAFLAVELPSNWLNPILGVLMIFLLILTLLKPKQWLKEVSTPTNNINYWKNIPIFFGIGFYGGFIQAGVGILLLSALVMGLGYNLRNANGLKLAIVLGFTIPALLLFIYHQQVNWTYGLWLAVGQSGGAWLAANFAIHYKKSNIWIRRLLIVILVLAIIKFFNLAALF